MHMYVSLLSSAYNLLVSHTIFFFILLTLDSMNHNDICTVPHSIWISISLMARLRLIMRAFQKTSEYICCFAVCRYVCVCGFARLVPTTDNNEHVDEQNMLLLLLLLLIYVLLH